MGVQLAQFYEVAKKIGGPKAQMRLAVLTATPSAKAELVPDTAELLKRFQDALNQIKAET